MSRMHIYIQTDIIGYNPAPGDLAYPEKLERMEVGLTDCCLKSVGEFCPYILI